MPVANSIARQLENASWIRRMFEEGVRLKRERGADAVFDFSLGNPDVEPPPAVLDALRRVVAGNRAGSHGYMPNPGFAEVREAVAGKLRHETGLDFTAEDVFMTVGAAGACNVILKSILDPSDEVLVLAPYFAEYQFYIANHGGRMVIVETDDSFLPDVERIAAAITPRTRALILNTPNNPTGRVYPESTLRDLDEMLSRAGQPIAVLSDEPYKSFVYDGGRQPEVASSIAHTAICNSWSKSLGLAGERIGYLALSPRLEDGATLRSACAFSNRTLGFVNAPAIWQRVILESMDETIGPAIYEQRRNVLCDALEAIGYEVRRPEGAFYVFLKTPIPDDIAFTRRLAEEGVLAVPGTGFGRSGYIRLSLTVPLEKIEGSIGGFRGAFLSSRGDNQG
ncbi:MAG: pyridoxal phosphate-dependent aminotransferase [Acidobacteriaceae bacterium]|jgi:aspartate aminotransferase